MNNNPLNTYGIPGHQMNNSSRNAGVNSKVKNKRGFLSAFKKSPNTKALLIIVIVLQILIFAVIGYYFLKVNERTLNQRIIAEAMKIAEVKRDDVPALYRIQDSQKLKTENAIQQEVYREARDGDYVVLFTDMMIIYRRETKEVLYKGDTPPQIAQKNQEKLMNDIVQKAKEQKLISASSTTTPELSVVTDVNILKENNENFYKDAQLGDVIAVFANDNVIMLYRPSSKTIYKHGTVETNINPK